MSEFNDEGQSKERENDAEKKPTDPDNVSPNQRLDDLANEYATKYF